MDEKITLDKNVFRSLASDTKINILKSLDERRKTLSEMSKEMKMSPSTIKEHLDGLVKTGLIEQKDDGHKWKYYELTKTSDEILHPGSRRLWIILSASVLSMCGVLYDLLRSGYNRFGEPVGGTFSSMKDEGMRAFSSEGMNASRGSGIMEALPKEDMVLNAGEAVSKEMPQIANNPPPIEPFMSSLPWAHIILLIIIAVIIGASLIFILLNRRLKVTNI